ncbi:MAG: serine hydrolase domain-containing protein, partial [Bacteroidota bacterium]
MEAHQPPVLGTPPKQSLKLSNPYLDTLLLQYESEIQALLNMSATPGAAVAIVKDSSIVFLKGFGVKAVDTNDSVDANTVFRLASVSKCFASFLTGILIEDSLMTWGDPVVSYLPDFTLRSPEQTKLLNLQHVLSHSTGLPYHAYTNLVEEGKDIDFLLESLKEVKLASNVGKEYSYQNVAYSIIGEVIKEATGKPYQLQMLEKVFLPLHMKNASIDYSSLIANPNIAKPHQMRNRGWRTATITDTYYNVAPAGGVNASAADMAQWMIALLGYRPDIIAPKTLAHLYTPVVPAPSKNRNYGRRHRLSRSFYGLGWRVLHYPNDTLIYHGGYVNGYRSEVAFDPNDQIAI